MGNHLKILITTSPGLEQELQKELLELCGKTASFRPQGPLELEVDINELCLILAGSFLASRVLYPVAEFHAWEEEVLFKEIYAIDWQNFFDKSYKGMDTFRIDAHGRTGGCDYTVQQALLKSKDALVDKLRDQWGERPDVDKENPSQHIEMFFSDGKVEVSLDLSKEPLHRRGYRAQLIGEAPLRESRAACMVRMSEALLTMPAKIYDPFCGGGTILIEAAMMLRKIPPALLRAVPNWKFIPGLADSYRKTVADLKARALPSSPIPLLGSDISKGALIRSRAAAERVGVKTDIILEHKSFQDQEIGEGVMISNPPFGERLGDELDAQLLLSEIGKKAKFKTQLSSMTLLLPTEYETAAGLRPTRKLRWKAGPLALSAVKYDLRR